MSQSTPGSGKIMPIESLAEILAGLKAQGKTVGLCHGCFDLLHLGHMKHFEAAAQAADILVVSVTPDRYVNKGPGRPVFNEQHRAEAIAALGAVDYVVVNKWPTAVELLGQLKPSLYIKGQDYKDAGEDLTGKIVDEIQAVESVGGKIHFTEEITFSSSKLINAHFSPHDDQVREYIDTLKSKFSSADIIEWINKLSGLKVLVIGDTIVDEYHYVLPLGKSSKSPTISSLFQNAVSYAGGVLAIANHVEQFAGKVHLVTCLGRENDQMEVIKPKLSGGIESKFFYREDGPTVTKRRYIARFMNAKLFEVSFMKDQPIEKKLEEEIISHLQSVIADYDVVLVADFGHGLITQGIQDYLATTGKFVAINAQTNSSNYGFNYITKYRNVSYISIDEAEIRLPFGDKYGSLELLIHRLHEITSCPDISITLGVKGAVFSSGGKFHYAPALNTTVVDSVGAGDAVLSITTLLNKAGCPPEMIPFVGNIVGSIAVNILGNERPVTKTEVTKTIDHLLK
jgi:rfaE bifunctional protein nucleotidyltransferase chain/domain